MISEVVIVLSILCTPIHSSPYRVSDAPLNGKRVYLRVWSESDALDYAKSENHDLPRLLSRSSEPAEVTPDLMALTIHAEDGSHVTGMLLQRNTRIQHPLTLQVGEEEEYTSLVGETEAQYQDSLSDAVFGMRYLDGQRHFDGSFHVSGVHYEVHPTEYEGEVAAQGLHEHKPHFITRAHAHNYSEPIVLNDDIQVQIEQQIQAEQLLKNGDNEKRTSSYDVELAIVVDYSEYLRWNLETLSPAGGMEAVKYKFSYIYNGIDHIYKTLDGISITIWLRKLAIQTSRDQSAVLDLYGTSIDPKKGKKETVDGLRVLRYEMKWGPSNGYRVPLDFDHVMYWVGYTISRDGSTATLGMAYTGQICGSHSYSIIEDMGFETYRIAAHELGHSLGSDHDDGTGDCSAKRRHIMAPTAGIARRGHETGWKFSTCSIAQFQQTLASKTCVQQNSVNSEFQPVSVSPLPGEKYGADWQCQWANMDRNSKYTHCSGGWVSSAECYSGLKCKASLSSECSRSDGSLRPADGTPCSPGTKKCINGKCQ